MACRAAVCNCEALGITFNSRCSAAPTEVIGITRKTKRLCFNACNSASAQHDRLGSKMSRATHFVGTAGLPQ